MLWKKGENGVSTPHVLSMRPYVQVPTKYAKKAHLMKSCYLSQSFEHNKKINYTICTSSYLNPLSHVTLSSRNNIINFNKSKPRK